MKAKMLIPVKQGENVGCFEIEGNLSMPVLDTTNGIGFFELPSDYCFIDCMPELNNTRWEESSGEINEQMRRYMSKNISRSGQG